MAGFKIITIFLVTLSMRSICSGSTFQNPIFENLTSHGYYGSILKHGGYYYLPLVTSDRRQIKLLESLKLSNFRNAESRVIYDAPEEAHHLVDLNLISFEGDLYLYFTIVFELQSLYVIKCMEPSNPLGEWSREVRLMPEWNRQAILPSVITYPYPHSEEGKDDVYLFWSSAEPGVANHMYIAKMEDPMTANSTARLFRSPNEDRGEGTFNESPNVTHRNHRAFLTFSTHNQNGPDRCLRLMGINCGLDPMTHSNWWDDVPHCFRRK